MVRATGSKPANRIAHVPRPTDNHHPHFLGAVVLQQVPKQTGQLQERTIIDGQQRLTTSQARVNEPHRHGGVDGSHREAAAWSGFLGYEFFRLVF